MRLNDAVALVESHRNRVRFGHRKLLHPGDGCTPKKGRINSVVLQSLRIEHWAVFIWYLKGNRIEEENENEERKFA